MDLLKVSGHAGLARDTTTGAIVNINKRDAEAARERKRRRQQAMVDQQRLESDVQDLKNEVSEVKDMLTKILEKL